MHTTDLINALQNPAIYDHAVDEIKVIETHISWLILTGNYAYKIKKPVDFGFLDFSSLEQRKHYCEQELQLNQRLAPNLYLEVVALTGSVERPVINGSDTPFEYAVKMRQFDPDMQLDNLLQRNKLNHDHIDQLADTIAGFHQKIEHAPNDSPFGSAEAVWYPVAENFDQIGSRLQNGEELTRLERLKTRSEQSFEQLKPIITARKQQGFIRNCHGDMHLANITLIGNKVTAFDCIEFNDNFRWIDVISEIAFTTMDLIDLKQPDFAARLLDRYLQHTGDYAGLALMRFYQTYRALVRAKVAILRHSQAGLSENKKAESLRQYKEYSRLAETFTQPQTPTLCIAHGVSGAGKTTLTQPLLERYGMIRLRSDVERKRLFGLSAEKKSGSNTDQGIYTTSASAQTYQQLLQLSQTTLQAGYHTIVDATFLKRDQRQMFCQLAQTLQTPFMILHFHADETLLRKWITQRHAEGKDASEATLEVLTQQLNTEETLEKNEAQIIISIDTGRDDAVDQLMIAASRYLRQHL